MTTQHERAQAFGLAVAAGGGLSYAELNAVMG